MDNGASSIKFVLWMCRKGQQRDEGRSYGVYPQVWCGRKNAAKMTRQPAIHPDCGAIAQLGERIVRNDEVVGSSPTSSTKF